MRIKALIVNIVLFVLLVNATTAIAQNVSNVTPEWDAVKALTSGEKLSVRLKDGKKMDGALRSVSDRLLVLNRGTNPIDLNRESISKVYRFAPRPAAKSVGKSAAMGAGIGFGIGAGVGIAGGATTDDLEIGGLVGLLGGFGAAIGAGIGALVGAIYVKPRRVLVYESK